MPPPPGRPLLPRGSQKSEVHTPSSTRRSSSTAPPALRPQHSQSRESLLHLQSPLRFPRVVLPDCIPPAVAGRVISGAKVLPEAWASPWCVRLRSRFLCAGVWGLSTEVAIR